MRHSLSLLGVLLLSTPALAEGQANGHERAAENLAEVVEHLQGLKNPNAVAHAAGNVQETLDNIDSSPATFPPVTVSVVDTIAQDAPCGVAIAQPAGGTYALVGNHDTDEVYSYALDLSTGALTPAGNASTSGDGPSGIGVNGEWVIVANELDNSVTVLRLDGATGELSAAQPPVDTSPAFAPAVVAVTDNYVVVGNRNGYVNIYRQNAGDGALVPYIQAEYLSLGIEDMAGGPNDTILVADPTLGPESTVTLYRINPGKTVSTLDQATVSDPVGVAYSGSRAYVASYATDGLTDIYSFDVVGGTSLTAVGSGPFRSATITDLAVASDGSRLLAAHSDPPAWEDELTVFAPVSTGLEEIGNGMLGTEFTDRNVASVAGNDPGVDLAVVSRLDLDEVVVVHIQE